MKQKRHRTKIWLLRLLIILTLYIPLVYSTKPFTCIDQYFLEEYKVLINTSMIKVEQYGRDPDITIRDYDNFSEGMGQDEIGKKFNDKFIIKSINNEGKENILNKSRFGLLREREKERYYAIDILFFPEACEKGLNIYKKDTGELVYASEFKLFYLPCYLAADATELCPTKNLPKKDIIPDTNLPTKDVQQKNIFQIFIEWLFKIFHKED